MKNLSPFVLSFAVAVAVAACGDSSSETETTETTSDPNTTGDGPTTTAESDTTPTTTGDPPGTTTGESTTDDPVLTTTTDDTTTDTPTTSTTDDTTSTTDDTTSTTDESESETEAETDTEETDTDTGSGLSWEVDVYPVVIGNKCGCHGNGAGGLTMTSAANAYMNLVDVKATQSALMRVAPGDFSASYLFHKVNNTHMTEGGGMGARMPLGDNALPDTTIDLLADWIDDGANP